jgi:hypothetical protein
MDIESLKNHTAIASYLELRHIASPENIDQRRNCTGLDNCIDCRITFCTDKALIRAGKIV